MEVLHLISSSLEKGFHSSCKSGRIFQETWFLHRNYHVIIYPSGSLSALKCTQLITRRAERLMPAGSHYNAHSWSLPNIRPFFMPFLLTQHRSGLCAVLESPALSHWIFGISRQSTKRGVRYWLSPQEYGTKVLVKISTVGQVRIHLQCPSKTTRLLLKSTFKKQLVYV